jgi:hypothetical protein
MNKPLNLFVSYARKDARMRNRVLQSLTPIEASGQIWVWWDGEIEPRSLSGLTPGTDFTNPS